MRPSRKHAEILIASLVLVGTLMWTAIIVHRVVELYGFELDRVARMAVAFTAAFTGAQVARRWLITLTTGELALSALLACAAGIGVIALRPVAPPRIGMLLPLAIVEAGVLLGSWISRRRDPEFAATAPPVRAIWRGIGAGLAAYGALLVTTGIAFLVSNEDSALAGFGGMLVGSALVVRFTSAGPADCAVGAGLIAASVGTAAAANATDVVLAIVFGFALSACVAGFGGRIGCWLRPKQAPAHELPGATVHGSRDRVS